MIYGIYPTSNEVIVTVNETTKVLPVENVCNITYISQNYTNYININITSNCVNLKEYINGTLVSTGGIYTPPYSGLYNVIITNNTYFINLTYIVSPVININKIFYGQWLNITLSPPLYRPGLVTIGPLEIPAVSQVAIPPFALPAGNYSLVLTQGNLTLLNTTITVLRSSPQISISLNKSMIYGVNNTFNVETFIFNINYKLNINVYINGDLVATGTTPFRSNLPILDAGTYNLTVVAAATANTTEAASSVVFRVLPAPVSLNVYVNGSPLGRVVVASYGQILVLNASARSTTRPVGAIKYVVDGNQVGYVVDTLSLGAGVHTLEVLFVPSNGDFLPAEVNATVVVSRSMPTLVAPRSITATYGETPNITAGLFVYGRPVPATLVVSVGNYTERVQVFGISTIQLPKLPAGIYEVVISFPGTKDLYPVSITSLLTIQSARVTLSVEAPGRTVYGSSVPISVSVSPQIPGIISIYVNGTLFYSAPGTQIQTYWRPPRSGVFNITVLFQSSSQNYSNSIYKFYIYVEKARCTISMALNSTEVYVLRRYVVLVNSSVIPDIYVDGRYIGSSIFMPIVFNSTGLHTIFALFKGDDRYTSCNSSLSVDVLRNPSSIFIHIAYNQVLPNSPIEIQLNIFTKSPIVNGSIYIYVMNINNKNNYTFIKYINSSRGDVSISLRTPGSYRIQVYYGGNQYVEGNYSNAVAVTVIQSVLGIPVIMVVSYGVSIASAYVVVAAIKLKRRKFSNS